MRPCIVALAIAVFLVGDVEAASRQQCATACRSTVVRCIIDGGRLRKCRRQAIRQCRRQGLGYCGVSGATTTTSPGVTLPGPTVTTTTRRTVTTSTSSTTTLPGLVRMSLLAWARYPLFAGAPPPQNTCGGVIGFFLALENAGGEPFGLPLWYYNNSCQGGTVLQTVPSDYRDDFFDYVFPTITTDPGAIRYCSDALVIPPESSSECMLWATERLFTGGSRRIAAGPCNLAIAWPSIEDPTLPASTYWVRCY